MKREQRLTTRQTWEQHTQEFQQAVNETLTELVGDIETANLVIAESYRQSPEQARAYALDALEHFNDCWPYLEEQFLVTGRWHMPSVHVSGNSVIVSHEEDDAFRAAQSIGFTIYEPVEEESAPMIGLSFLLKQVRVDNTFLSFNADISSFAELNKVSLQYLRPESLDVVSSDLEEIASALKRANALVLLYTTHADSEFYRVSGRRQHQMVESIIQSIEETLPTPESKDLLQVKAQTPVVFLQNYQGETLTPLAVKTDTPLKISGTILGVTTLDKVASVQQEAQDRYTSPEDCHLAQQGLSIIINPDDTNFDLPDYEGNFILPVQYARDLELDLI